MSIRAVIWDLGGVIVRTEDRAPRDALAERLGVTRGYLSGLVFGQDGDYRAQLGQIQAEEQWGNAARKLGIPPEEMPAFIKQFFAGDSLDSKLVDYIRGLKRNYTTALLSNALSDLRELVTQVWRIEDAFHHVVISAEVGLMKPDAAIYELALEKIGCAPQEALFVDDVEENVLAAQEVGMQAIRFQGREETIEEVEGLLKE